MELDSWLSEDAKASKAQWLKPLDALRLFRSTNIGRAQQLVLRQVLQSGNLDPKIYRLNDREVIEHVESGLTRGTLRMWPNEQPEKPSYAQRVHAPAKPVAPRPPAAPPPPPPKPEAPAEPPWPGDAVAQAKVLLDAAEEAASFCELCERAG